jgi:hypothetical protein
MIDELTFVSVGMSVIPEPARDVAGRPAEVLASAGTVVERL